MTSAAEALGIRAELAEQTPEELIQRMQRHVWLVSLSISWPKLNHQIGEATVEVQTGDDDESKKSIPEEFRTKPNWQLIPEAWKKRLTSFESATRKILTEPSINFSAKGSVLLPISKVPDVFRQLRAARAELCGDPLDPDGPRVGMVDEFISEWNGNLARIRQAMIEHAGQTAGEQLYAKAVAKLPSAEQLRDKFNVVWCIIPLDSGGGGEAGVTLEWLQRTRQDLASIRDDLPTHADEHHSLDDVIGRIESMERSAAGENTHRLSAVDADELVREARGQMRDYIAQAVEDMAVEPRQRIAESVENLLTAIADPDRAVRNGTIGQVERAFELLEGFNFLADDDLLSRMRDCRERLQGVTPRQLNSNTEIGANLGGYLRPVAEAARNAASASQAARNFSGIRIRGRRNRPGMAEATDASPEEEPAAV